MPSSPPPTSPPPPPPTRVFDDASRQSYDDAYHGETYRTITGQVVLPTGEPEPLDPELRKTWKPTVVIKLHEPFRIRTSEYRYDRQNTPPMLPKVANSGRFVALGGEHKFAFSPNLDGSSNRYSASCSVVTVEQANLRCVTGFTTGDEAYTLEQQRRMPSVTGVPAKSDESDKIIETGATRQGQIIGSYIDHADPYSGMAPFGGVYSVTSWIPDTCFSDTMISAGGLPIPNPPPPASPPPVSPPPPP